MMLRSTYHPIFLLRILRGFGIMAFLLASISVRCQDNTLTVVSNAKGAPADLKMSELKSIFLGERQRWSDGTKVVIAMVKTTTPLGETISRRIYSKSGDGVRGFWASISFAGKFDPPNVFNTVSEMESFIFQNPGAIGILDKPSNSTELRIVQIDGKKSF